MSSEDGLITRAQKTKAMRRFKESLTKGNLFLYILRLLEEKDRYGYELKEALLEGYQLRLSGVTPYSILYKMTKEGLIKLEKEKESPYRKPVRKYYKITPLGEALLQVSKEFMADTFQIIFNEKPMQN